MIELPKLINKAELARILYPDNSNAPASLNNKLKGTNRQRFTEEDKQKTIEALKKTIQELEDLNI